MEMFKTEGPSKDHATRHVLMAEAERRVRQGELRCVVAHDLQIPASTIAIWAARGRWRKTDLDREAAGLPPLPLPYYARDDRNISAGSGKAKAEAGASRNRAPNEGAPCAAETGQAVDLKNEAAACGRAAREAFKRGDLKTAEAKLKDARRLLRLEAGLATLASEMTPAQKERARILAMSDEEAMEELRRVAGLG